MQATNYSERHPRRDGRLHTGRQPVLPRPGHAARSAEERLRRQPRLRRARSSRTSCGSSAPRGGRRAENYVPNNYPNLNFVAGQTSPTLLNRTTAAYAPGHEPGSADDARRRRPVLGADHAPQLAGDARRTRSASTTTTRSGRTSTPPTTPRGESRASGYFFPFSDQLVQWSAPQTNRLLLEAGFWRHQETWGGKRAPNDIVDPLAVGITDNNPQTHVPGYVAVDPELPRARGLHRHGQPQPELPQQLQPVLRDGLALVQDRASTSTAPAAGPTSRRSCPTAWW